MDTRETRETRQMPVRMAGGNGLRFAHHKQKRIRYYPCPPVPVAISTCQSTMSQIHMFLKRMHQYRKTKPKVGPWGLYFEDNIMICPLSFINYYYFHPLYLWPHSSSLTHTPLIHSPNMGDDTLNPPTMPEPTTRPVGGTEFSWCKAVPGGTGITVLGLLLSKPPPISILQNALHSLQNSHPVLRSRIHLDPSTNTFHFLTPPNPRIQIERFDLQSTAHIAQSESNGHDHNNHTDPFLVLLEHEMNRNTWRDPSGGDPDVLYASAYEISERRFAVFLRLHTAACDRAAAVALLREILRRVGGGGGGEKEEMMNVAIEELIPEEKRNKAFWARGLDMLGYSLNAFRLGNLGFVDADSPRKSKVARFQLNAEETKSLVAVSHHHSFISIFLCTNISSLVRIKKKRIGIHSC